MQYTAQQAWEAGSLKRLALLSRCEKYAAFTQPLICPPQGYNEQSEELQTDFQSLGNQLVNNLSNKLMLALFAPSRPFFRLDVPPQLMQQLTARLSVPVESLQGQLAVAERNCIKQLDKMGIRPKLYLALKHLIITGNCLIVLGKKDVPMRVLGLKRFVVKRSMTGRIIEIVIHEKVRFDELEHDVQAHLKSVRQQQYGRMNPLDPNTCNEVSYFKWIRWDGEKERYTETTQIGDLDLGPQFQGTYSEKDLPYRVLTWELADENDYGTGLVEQNAGDFAALSVLSESEVKGAILASEFRWLVNPAGQTNAADLEASENGAALPGVKDDIIPLITGTGANMQFVDTVATKYVNRLGRTFLLGASVIRDAERVTAEEVRLVANELETALGGVYSRLAIDFQLPMAYWLVELTGVKLGETEIEPTIVTGLDALSRNGDLDNLKACIMDLAALSGIPPQAQFVLKMDAIAQAIFAGRGVDSTQYIKSPDEQKAELENQQAAALAQQVARPVSSAFLNANSPQG